VENPDEYEKTAYIAAWVDGLPSGMGKGHRVWSMGDGVKSGSIDNLLVERKVRNGLCGTL
jgi:hypothetical protein